MRSSGHSRKPRASTSTDDQRRVGDLKLPGTYRRPRSCSAPRQGRLAHAASLPTSDIEHKETEGFIEVTDDAKIRRIEMFFDDQAAVENLNWWMRSGAEAPET